MVPRKQRLAAEKGLAFLEGKYPGCLEWFDLETLNLRNPYYCALAQASCRPYSVAKNELELRDFTAVEYGFLSDAPTHAGERRVYKWLTAAYKELVLERRAA